MALATEDLETIKAHLTDWIAELGLHVSTVSYEIELRERVLNVEKELAHQRELMLAGFDAMEKRFEQVDKRFEQVDKRFESIQASMDKRFEQSDKRFESMQASMDKRFEAMQANMDKRFDAMERRFESMERRMEVFMRWSFGMTLSVGGLIVAILKFT